MKTIWKYIWKYVPVIMLVGIIIGAIILLWQPIWSVLSLITLKVALITLFGFLFFMFNEFEDESVNSHWTTNVEFLNKVHSWKNKWKLNGGRLIKTEKHYWYHFGVNPKYAERFPYSSTILVFLTDGEHLFQFLKKRSIDAAMLVLGWQYTVAWMVGVSLFSFIKEKFLKQIQ